MNSFSIRTLILLAMLLPQVSWAVAEAPLAEPAPVPTEAGSASSSSDAERAESISRADLAALAEQFNAQIEALRQEFASSLKSQQTTIAEQERLITTQTMEIETQKGALAALNAQLSQLEATRQSSLQAGETRLTERLAYLEQKLTEEPEDPLTALADETFPGSWRLPGTNAAMRIGGYVKMNIVQSFRPLVTRDRFIVGGIPPRGTFPDGAEKGASLTAQQSRVNLDLRDHTDLGLLRAFVEGDFAGTGNSFRLRHAYGQFGNLLAGQTWSTLMDPAQLPEELDFEGTNGAIIARQPQLRFFPQIGKNLNLRVALEDPQPDVSGGVSSSSAPDLIASLDWSNSSVIRQTLLRDWTLRTGLIARQVRARPLSATDEVASTPGWGVTFSGQIPLNRLHANDVLRWQVTAGEGIGRYINDLGTIGGQDAVFSPEGKLEPLPVFAGYLSFQHWWNERWRSNLNFSWVEVDTYDFQSLPEYIAQFGAPYDRTLRAGLNLLFTPVRRLELGAELLWGERRNADGTGGDASQLQVSARYLY